MDIESVLELMRERGYMMISHSGDRTQYNMANLNNELNTTLRKSGDSS